MKIVIDTNIFIAAIIKPSFVRRLIVESNADLLFPETIIEEIEKNKDEILRKSGLSDEDLQTVINILLDYVELIPKSEIRPYMKEASGIINRIDPEDTPFIAACLAQNAILWSDDKDLKKQIKIKVLNTKEIMRIL